MANTLTGLIPDFYKSFQIVSRELVGFIPAVTLDADAARAAVGQNITDYKTRSASAVDIVPGMEVPDAGDQTVDPAQFTITKSRMVPIRWTGEEERALAAGHTASAIRVKQIAQAMRTLTNEIEADVAGLYTKASRAYGTPAQVPFGTAGDYSDAAQVLKILQDNGAPQSEMSLVLNTAAGANIRGKQADADKVGTTNILRQGVLDNRHGFMLRESAQVATHTAGTAAATATTNAAGYAVGAKTITLASAGTGTLVAGDVITFAGDANKYVVASGDADVSNGGTITLAAPGLRKALPASATAITVVAGGPRMLAFPRSALVLATRLPSLPASGDKAVDRMTVTDPVSGISFEVAMYPGFRQMTWTIGAAWGVYAANPEHVAVLIG